MQYLYNYIIKLIQNIQQIIISYTHSRYAEAILYLIAFTESFIFPLPPDVLLLPMVFSRRPYAFRYAFGATLTSVLGGLVGYFIGELLFSSLGMWIIDFYNLHHIYEKARIWFAEYGVITMLIAGLTPIPYKLATLLAGTFQFALFPFIITSCISRAFRFFLIASLPYLVDTSFGRKIQKNLGIVLFFVLLSLIALYLLFVRR